MLLVVKESKFIKSKQSPVQQEIHPRSCSGDGLLSDVGTLMSIASEVSLGLGLECISTGVVVPDIAAQESSRLRLMCVRTTLHITGNIKP
jgi:hypothetical protein